MQVTPVDTCGIAMVGCQLVEVNRGTCFFAIVSFIVIHSIIFFLARPFMISRCSSSQPHSYQMTYVHCLQIDRFYSNPSNIASETFLGASSGNSDSFRPTLLRSWCIFLFFFLHSSLDAPLCSSFCVRLYRMFTCVIHISLFCREICS